MYEVPPDLVLSRIAETLDEVITPNLPSTYLRTQATAMGTALRFLSASFARQDAVLKEENVAAEAVLRLMMEALAHADAAAPGRQLESEIRQTLERSSDAGPLERNLQLKGTLVRAIKDLQVLEHRFSSETRKQLDDQLASQLRLGIRRDLEIYDAVITGRRARQDARSNE